MEVSCDVPTFEAYLQWHRQCYPIAVASFRASFQG